MIESLARKAAICSCLFASQESRLTSHSILKSSNRRFSIQGAFPEFVFTVERWRPAIAGSPAAVNSGQSSQSSSLGLDVVRVFRARPEIPPGAWSQGTNSRGCNLAMNAFASAAAHRLIVRTSRFVDSFRSCEKHLRGLSPIRVAVGFPSTISRSMARYVRKTVRKNFSIQVAAVPGRICRRWARRKLLRSSAT